MYVHGLVYTDAPHDARQIPFCAGRLGEQGLYLGRLPLELRRFVSSTA